MDGSNLEDVTADQVTEEIAIAKEEKASKGGNFCTSMCLRVHVYLQKTEDRLYKLSKYSNKIMSITFIDKLISITLINTYILQYCTDLKV